jgi:hypothetical protein
MSIYNLPTSDEQLKAWTQRTQKAGTQQHASIANVTGSQFGNQDIRIPFLVAGNRWWLPGKSYVRMRCRVETPAGKTISQDPSVSRVAPTMGFAATLFQNCEFLIRGVTVSRLNDFVPQADQYYKRTQHSYQWMKTVGESMDYQQLSWEDRAAAWNYTRDSKGFVNTDYFTAFDLLHNPQVAPNFQITFGTDAGAGNVSSAEEFIDITNVGLDGGLVNNALQPGDRIFLPSEGQTAAAPVPAEGQGHPGHSFTIVQVEVTAANVQRYRINHAQISATGIYDIATTDNARRFQVQRDNRVQIEPISADVFEVCWQPPLSIFGIQHALPSMSCELVLKGRPGLAYSYAAVSTRPGTYTQPPADTRLISYDANADATAVRVTVDNIYLYTYQMESDRLDDGTFLIDLEELQVSAQNLQVGNSSVQQLNYLVSPSTYQLGVAFQDTRAGNGTTQFPLTKLTYHERKALLGGPPNIELKNNTDLTRLFIQYANTTFPQPDAQPEFVLKSSKVGGGSIDVAGTSFQVQRWAESQLATGLFHDPGGPEPIEVWLSKGPLYVFPTLKDPTDRSTNVIVNTQFASGKAPDTAMCILFSMCRKVATVRVANGMVQEVDVADQ